MEAKDKARELYDKFQEHSESICEKMHTKACVLISINEIESALIQCGELSDSLQNMDRELNYWHNVRKEVESFKS